MNYSEIYDDFVNLFPNDRRYFEEISSKTEITVSDGMHLAFGLNILPFIKKIIDNDPDKAILAFDYIEKMEVSGNPQIAEVVEFTVLEGLLDLDKELLKAAYDYMGSETKLAFDSIQKWHK